MKIATLLAAFQVSLLTICSSATDWAQWRGPTGNGVAPDGPMPPLEFGENKNVVWKIKIPGRGHGSPSIVGNRIFIPSAIHDTGEQFLLAIDRATGKALWKTRVHPGGRAPKIHLKNTHASATAACDGERIFITFHHAGHIFLSALTVDGDKLWQQDLGRFTQKYEFGYAASPVLYRDMVIVLAESESTHRLAAFDRAAGKLIWTTLRPKNSSYSTPALAHIDGVDQLICQGNKELRGYDAASGKELWNVEAAAQHTAGTPVILDNFVAASGGYPQSLTTCVEVKGRTAQRIWENKQKSYEQSMIATAGHLYALTDGGIAYCWELKSGQEKWRQRLKGPVSASPVLVGDRIYAFNERGSCFVFAANPDRFESLATNMLGNDTFATPTVLDGRIYMRYAHRDGDRRQEYLVCIGVKSDK